MKSLQADIEKDLSSFTDELYQEIKNTTPVQTGVAKKGWRKGKVNLDNSKSTIITNGVPYIDELNAGSSQQAPDGIVSPAIKKVSGKYQ
tara:strand:+ start:228 stop:494 length:267 start_codon:yes stop_codon:yes gene_type:complete